MNSYQSTEESSIHFCFVLLWSTRNTMEALFGPVSAHLICQLCPLSQLSTHHCFWLNNRMFLGEMRIYLDIYIYIYIYIYSELVGTLDLQNPPGTLFQCRTSSCLFPKTTKCVHAQAPLSRSGYGETHHKKAHPPLHLSKASRSLMPCEACMFMG